MRARSRGRRKSTTSGGAETTRRRPPQGLDCPGEPRHEGPGPAGGCVMRMRDRALAALKEKGVARLFPLPDLVLFPHVLLPLHIFEPRYRLLTEDALAS